MSYRSFICCDIGLCQNKSELDEDEHTPGWGMHFDTHYCPGHWKVRWVKQIKDLWEKPKLDESNHLQEWIDIRDMAFNSLEADLAAGYCVEFSELVYAAVDAAFYAHNGSLKWWGGADPMIYAGELINCLAISFLGKNNDLL